MVDIVVFGLECYFIAACYVPMAKRVVKKICVIQGHEAMLHPNLMHDAHTPVTR
eukprot:COSAG06_NODE_2273_length_7196_cov_6.990982_4_plen_54_part_00